LGDISVQGLPIFEVGLEADFVDFLFGFAEDDGTSVASSVEVDEIRDDGVAVVVGTVECEVFYSFGGADFRVLDKVNKFTIRGEVLSGEVKHP
jgi:hypothetical protein